MNFSFMFTFDENMKMYLNWRERDHAEETNLLSAHYSCRAIITNNVRNKNKINNYTFFDSQTTI